MLLRLAAAALLCGACLLTIQPATAGVMPPGASDLLYRGEPVLVCYTSVPPYCFVNGKLRIVNFNPAVVNVSGDLESFDAEFTGDFTIGSVPAGPITFTGSGQFILPDRTNDAMLGAFSAEMLSLDLAGPGDLRLRESPTQSSTGVTTVGNDGSGNFVVSSFFDIFTELSIDGGETWVPRDVNQPLEVTYTPEPASWLLAAASLLVLARRRAARV